MKKLIIILAAALVAAGVVAGTVFATGASNGATTETKTEAATEAKRTTTKEADREVSERFNNTAQKYAENYEGDETMKGPEGNRLAMRELKGICLELTKAHGYSPADWDLEYIIKDRSIYYDFLVDCCDLYNNTEIQLADEEASSLKLLLIKDRVNIRTDENNPNLDFEPIREKRDATLKIIETTGIIY